MSSDITKDSCSIVVGGIGRRAYLNSSQGRAYLLKDCTEQHVPDLYEEVMQIWGASPAVTETSDPDPTFDELKTQKKAEIAAARYAAETGDVTVAGAVIATDRGSQSLLTAAVVMARLEPEFSVKWKCADNRFVTLDSVQLKAIGDAVTAHVEACFAREGELCEQIDAAQTPEELAAIQWSL